jgi:hypothetical protein
MVAEIVDGELFASPRRAPRHAVAASVLGADLNAHNERHDRTRKLPVYAREGVRHAWIVDPLEQSLEVLRLEAGRWSLLSTQRGDAIVRAEPFQAIDVDLLPLWGESRKSG